MLGCSSRDCVIQVLSKQKSFDAGAYSVELSPKTRTLLRFAGFHLLYEQDLTALMAS